MTSQDLREELMDEIDEEWAERIRLLPLSNMQPDPEREQTEFYAVLRTNDQTREDMNFDKGNVSRAAFMASGGMLRINPMAWPELELREGDKILALDRPDEPVFEIGSVDRRSHLRLVCLLKDAN